MTESARSIRIAREKLVDRRCALRRCFDQRSMADRKAHDLLGVEALGKALAPIV